MAKRQFIRLSKEQCTAEALKYPTRGEFKKHLRSIYNYVWRKGWINEVCAHTTPVRTSWAKEECHAASLKYETRSEFYKGSSRQYSYALDKGWLDEICSHMTSVMNYWTKDQCAEEALKYKNRVGFQKGSKAKYHYALTKGWLEEICSHMVPLCTAWTIKQCHDEALKYETRTAFARGAHKYYYYAVRHGWIDDICYHMVRGQYGFDPRKLGYFYIVSFGDYAGFGITNFRKTRLNQHRCNIESANMVMQVVKVIEFQFGKDANDLELHIKRTLQIVNTGVNGFKTEAIQANDLSLLLTEIENFLTLRKIQSRILDTKPKEK